MSSHWIVLRIGPFKSETIATEVSKKIAAKLADVAEVRIDVVDMKKKGTHHLTS